MSMVNTPRPPPRGDKAPPGFPVLPIAARSLHCAFTLVELIVVAAIIAVLASLLLPTVSLVRDSAKTVACASNLRQLGLCLLSYAADHDGGLPPRQIAAPERDLLGLPYWGMTIGFIQEHLPQTDGWQIFNCPAGNWSRAQCMALGGTSTVNQAFYLSWSSFGMNANALNAWCVPPGTPATPDRQWRYNINRVPRTSQTIYFTESWNIGTSMTQPSSNGAVDYPRYRLPMSGARRPPDAGCSYVSLRLSHHERANALFFDGGIRLFDWRASCVPLPGAYAKPDQWTGDY